MNARRLAAVVLTATACVAFGLGLAAPLFSVTPGMGRWTALARIVAREELATQVFTLPGGIGMLWSGGELTLAVLLGMLSVVLPVIKLCVLWWEAFAPDALPAGMLRFFRVVAHYAMVEVFLVALTALLAKGLPGGSQITLQLGTYAFALSVLLSLVASRLLAGSLAVLTPDRAGPDL